MATFRKSHFSSEQRSFISDRNVAVKEARGLGIHVEGLAELRRDLRRLAPEIDKQLRKDLREIAKPILARGRELAPRRSGDLARSLRISVRGRGVSIGSSLPYAPLIHWGGSTGRGHVPNQPWSGSVFVRPSLFLSRALEEQADRVVDEMGDAVERTAQRLGWRDTHNRPLAT